MARAAKRKAAPKAKARTAKRTAATPAAKKRAPAKVAKPARKAPAPLAQARQEFSVPGLNPPISHYCDAVRFGDLLFISGMAPVDADLKLIGWGDAVAQAEAVFASLGKVLDAAGASFADVLKVTVFLTNIDDRTRINPVRQRHFGTARPASTLVEVSRLAIPGMKVEIEAVVGLPKGRKGK